MTKKVLYVDMDNVLVDFQSAIPFISEETLKEYADKWDDIPSIFSYMTPMEGAIESFNELSALFDTYILSTASWKNPSAWSDKLCWVQKYLEKSAHKRLILTHHKELNKGDFLIDDRTKNGAGQFEGELIQFGTPEFPDWKTVVNYLVKKAH